MWPGCTQSPHLHIHHIKHWAGGGPTSVENGACLCSYHHTLVHEGGYTIERVDDRPQLLTEQFIQQQHVFDNNQFEFEQSLRNDQESFNKVRKLSPSNFRIRITDGNGRSSREQPANEEFGVGANRGENGYVDVNRNQTESRFE